MTMILTESGLILGLFPAVRLLEKSSMALVQAWHPWSRILSLVERRRTSSEDLLTGHSYNLYTFYEETPL